MDQILVAVEVIANKMKQIDDLKQGYLDRAINILTECDPSLECLEAFYAGPYPVLHVRRNNEEYIFKPAIKSYDHELLPKEARILSDLKDVKGITHLVERYGKKSEVKAILKEFFPGKRLGNEEQITSHRLRKKLEDTVKEIHEVGYVYLDIYEGNIILSDDKKDVCFIDPIQGHTLAENSERKRNIDRCMLRQLFSQS